MVRFRVVSSACPVVHACPTCRARKGEMCRSVRGPVRLIRSYHKARLARAQERA